MGEMKKFQFNWAGRELVVEVGEMGKQANGAAMITYGDSSVFSTVVTVNKPSALDFFPLMVIYQEKLYAAGKIPGGFLKREGRPSEHETLTSRVIDRPIRPLFPEGFRNEVQIVNTVMSSDVNCSTEMAAMFGSSLVLGISDVPFNGPIAGVEVGRIDGEYILMPTPEQKEKSDIALTVAGTKYAVNMIEAGAREVSEEAMLGAILFGHEAIKELIKFQEEIIEAVGKPKMEVSLFEVDQDVRKLVYDYAYDRLVKAIVIEDKLERYAAIDEINEETMAKFDEKVFIKDLEGVKVLDTEAKDLYMHSVKFSLDEILNNEVRRLISVDKVRPDGRLLDEIRPLSSRVDVLPRAHGSSLFTRGQTQSLGVTTLGSLGEHQIIDGLGEEDNKRFMFHYNFPPFSVGETGRYGAPGRREIGHGALAERALSYVIPSEEEFPYTIRVVSEILESNGSSSQASICSGTMSLMAAGVPIKAPVAGIAMGLIKEGEYYTILTDIQGMEDHLGDMDFKVAGTRDGITALQMDIKIDGIDEKILREALTQAKKGRMEILDHMQNTISEYRKELSPYAPKVKMMKIDPEKIRDVIGAGGKTITSIIEQCNDVKIDIEQDGRVFLMHSEVIWIDKAMEIIEGIVREAKVGEIYTGTVTRILMDKEGKKSVGAFVEIWKGCEGMVHISKLAKERVEKVEDVVSVGDQIVVKCIKIDEKGRIDLSRKDALEG